MTSEGALQVGALIVTNCVLGAACLALVLAVAGGAAADVAARFLGRAGRGAAATVPPCATPCAPARGDDDAMPDGWPPLPDEARAPCGALPG